MPVGTLWVRIGIVRKRDKRKYRHFSVHQTRRRKSIQYSDGAALFQAEAVSHDRYTRHRHRR